MRRIFLWMGVIVAVQLLFSLLLKPIARDNEVFVAAAVLIVANFLWIEVCRLLKIEAYRLIYFATLTYIAALVPLWPSIRRWMLQIEPSAPAWLSEIADPLVYLVSLFLLVGFTQMLLRLSFSTTEIYESVLRGGHRPWEWPRRTPAQPNGGPK
jgi:hypothetical protein